MRRESSTLTPTRYQTILSKLKNSLNNIELSLRNKSSDLEGLIAETIITDIEKDFDVAILGLMKLDKDSFFGVYVAYRYYRELMQKIKKINMSRLRKERIRVSNFRKFSLILNSRIKIALGLF